MKTTPSCKRILRARPGNTEQLAEYRRRKAGGPAAGIHRRLGIDLDLFSSKTEAGGCGLVFWHSPGAASAADQEFWREAPLCGLITSSSHPPCADFSASGQTSGHLDFYRRACSGRCRVDEAPDSSSSR